VYAWSTGATTQQVGNLGAGMYSVTVTDIKGCTATASTTLTEPTELTVGFLVTDLTCFGFNNGVITVEPSGGVPPYRYSKNNGALQSSNVFSGLGAGTYNITTVDANDCERSEILIVNAAKQITVDLGDNQTIQIGDSTVLQAIVNFPIDSILSVVWTPPTDSSDCVECLTQVVAPFVSTTYSVRVQAINGCTDEDKVTVFVDRRRYVYFPNIFSPNGDGDNDLFTISAKPGTVKTIRSIQLYDRWGEKLYENRNFQPNIGTIGWDGRLNGQPMSPGVFVWYCEVEFIDGVIELYKGDVTIFR
jgi:gliding motility-associated-like protein